MTKSMDTTTDATLPTVGDRPDAHVVIFDGQCGFCQHQMRRLLSMDRNGQLAFVSLHDDLVAQRWPELSRETLMSRMCLVATDGSFHFGADAFRRMSRVVPSLWPLRLLMSIPFTMPIWRLGYRIVAKQRYWLSKQYDCSDGACQVHY